MSARISVKGEIPEMEKQMGCMNGLLQLFDRHYFLNGRRMNQKSLPPTARHNNGNQLTEPPNSALQKSPGKNVKVVKEKQRISTESSRTSCSSSTSCSSFSSLDNTRPAPVDSPLLSRAASTQHFLKNQTLNSRKFYQSPDLQDALKNSSKREAHGLLSLKTGSAKPALGHNLKPIDSPRPTPPPKFSEHRASDSSVSPRVQAKLQEQHLNIKGGMNGGNLVQVPKCAHRHSYDGRELHDTPKSSMKFKELPRLSLDSRDDRAKGSASRTRSSDRLNGMMSEQQEAPFSKRPSTVIAKLMGLEAFPDSTSANENMIEACSSNKQHPLSRLPDLESSNSTMNLSDSPRIPIQMSPSNREVTTKSPRNPRSVYGEIEQRLATIEFKKSGKDLRALKQILEAMQKNKDLLDNKREQASDITSQSSNTSILDNSSELTSPNMQRVKITSPARTPISPKSSKSPIIIMKPAKITRKELNSASLGQPSQKVPELQKLQIDHFSDNRNKKLNKQLTADLTSSENHRRYIHPGHTSTKHLSSTEKRTNMKSLNTTQITRVLQHVHGELSTNSGSIPGTVSPRLHLKIAVEKQPSSLSYSSRTRSEHIRLKTESCLAETNLKNKGLILQQKCNTEERCKRNDIRGCFTRHETALSLQSKSMANLAREGTSMYQFDKITSKTTNDDCKQKNSTTGLSRIAHMEESPTPSLEQPSPVSVLDPTIYPEDLSPVKKKLYAFKDDDSLNPIYEAVCPEWEIQSPVRIKRLGADINKKLESIQQLRKNLYEQKCINEEKTMDCIHLSQEKENPRHQYISEILLASGILRDLDFSFAFLQLPFSGHLINPQLFFVLEQTQDSTWFSDDESSVNMPKSVFVQKTQRRLVFDTVNEILIGNIEAKGSCKLSLSESVETCTKIKAQQLLKDLCAQVDQLQCSHSSTRLDDSDICSHMIVCDDLVRQSTNWKGCHNEVSLLALDIERLIFKDLITEVVISEADDVLQSWSVGCCRRLFSA